MMERTAIGAEAQAGSVQGEAVELARVRRALTQGDGDSDGRWEQSEEQSPHNLSLNRAAAAKGLIRPISSKRQPCHRH